MTQPRTFETLIAAISILTSGSFAGCGDDLSRANVMKQMASLEDVEAPIMLPGITWDTSAADSYAVESSQLMRFDGYQWQPFGKIIGN